MANELTHPVTSAVSDATAQLGRTVSESTGALEQAFRLAWVQVVANTPKLIAAVALLVVGYVVARFVSRAIVNLCERLGLQRAVERGELAQSMRQVGIQRSVPQILGAITFWALIFVFLMATFKYLEWDTVSAPMQKVVNYIPNVLAATFLVVVGLLFATLLRGFIATGADRAGLSYAQQLANGAYYVLAVVTFLAALHQLNIDTKLLDNLILIASGAAAVGFALAFGLGGRDVVGGILSGYYLRQRVQAGDHVQIGSMEGIVREVGPVATIIETQEQGLMHRHSIPNTKMLNEAIR